MVDSSRPVALVTGASSGFGRELALLCATNGFDLIVAADESLIDVTVELRALGAHVDIVQTDLATLQGVDELYGAVNGRPIAALLMNATHALRDRFLDQSFREVSQAIDTHITATTYLVQKVGREMRTRQQGYILITGAMATLMADTVQPVYNATQAFIESFVLAMREEFKDTGVTISALMLEASGPILNEQTRALQMLVADQDDEVDSHEADPVDFIPRREHSGDSLHL